MKVKRVRRRERVRGGERINIGRRGRREAKKCEVSHYLSSLLILLLFSYRSGLSIAIVSCSYFSLLLLPLPLPLPSPPSPLPLPLPSLPSLLLSNFFALFLINMNLQILKTHKVSFGWWIATIAKELSM